MIDGLKPYPEYKDSRLPWVNEVPAHWREWRLDRLFELRKETPLPEDQRVTAYLSGRVTLRTNVQGQKIKGVIKDGGWQRIHPGDFAISGMNAHLGGMGVSDSLGKCSPIYLILKPKPRTNAHFVSHAVRHIAHAGALKSFVNTIRFNSADFKRDALKLFRILLPSEDEQTLIVAFIDYANGRIERAIHAKKRMIALLNEQKQAFIHRAVTRGLDPNVPLKPSGLPWAADIPQHWELLPNRSLLKSRKQIVGDKSRDYLLLSLTLRGIIPRDMQNPTGKFPVDFATYQVVESGDLVFCLFDIDETPRCVGVSNQSGMITGAYTVFQCADPELAQFLLLFYLAMDEHKRLKPLYTGLRKVIKKGTFLGIKTPIPPESERREILSIVNDESKRLDTIIERTEREIRLLREYRTRLIADVITGKLDVREAAADLPEQATESEVTCSEAESEEDLVGLAELEQDDE